METVSVTTKHSQGGSQTKKTGKKTSGRKGPRLIKTAESMPVRPMRSVRGSAVGRGGRLVSRNRTNPSTPKVGASVNQKAATTAIIAALSLPASSPPVRWPGGGFDSDPTAVASPFTLQPIAFPVPSGTDIPAPMVQSATTLPIFAFRDPMRSVVVYTANPSPGSSNVISVYVGQFYDATEGIIQSWPVSLGPNPINPAYFSCISTAWQAHGPVLYLGASPSKNRRFFWLNRCDTLVFTLTGLTSDSAGAITLYNWSGAADANAGEQTFSGAGTTTFTFGTADGVSGVQPGYYAAELDCSAAAPATVSMSFTVNQDCFSHLALKNFSSNLPFIQKARVTAVSLMLTNTSQVLDLAGENACMQMKAPKHWFNAAFGNFSSIQSLKGCTNMIAREGSYGFLKPLEEDDFKMNAHWSYDPNLGCLMDSFYPLAEKSDYLLIFSKVDNVLGQAGFFTAAHAVEYETDDVWRDTQLCHLTNAQALLACKAVQQIEQWHKNALHLDEIWSKIKSFGGKVLNGIINYGPKIIEGAATVLPFLL